MKFFLVLFFLSPFILSKEVPLPPIELEYTNLPSKLWCNVGSSIITLDLNNETDKNFVTYTAPLGLFKNRKEEVRVKIKRLKVSNKYISFNQRVPLPQNSLAVSVNRETLGITSSIGEGECMMPIEDWIKWYF